MTAPAPPIHVIAATGRFGQALCRSLLADGVPFVPVVRSAEQWRRTDLPGECRIADLGDATALCAALCDAERVVSAAHARHAGAVMAAATAATRFVFLGSTRKFTRWPDPHGRGVIAGEAAFLAAGRPGVMIHPTMIYGAQGEDNVRRLAALLRRLPIVPLPGGGRSLVQPVWQNDLVRMVRAALDHAWTAPTTLIAAGPEPLSYAAFTRAVAKAAGLPQPRIVPVPALPLRLLAPLTRLLPGPTIRSAELRRLLEDKAFDPAPLGRTLGVWPTKLPDGLAATFAWPE